MSLYQFPRWTDAIRPLLGVTALGAPVYLVLLFYYGASPKTLAVGYEPTQPVPFSHDHHTAGLGIDCRHCHTSVEESAFAGIPPTATCMNCHNIMWKRQDMLEPVREAWRTGEPLRWNRIYDLPDYVYFDHSIHLNKGMACDEASGVSMKSELVSHEAGARVFAWGQLQHVCARARLPQNMVGGAMTVI